MDSIKAAMLSAPTLRELESFPESRVRQSRWLVCGPMVRAGSFKNTVFDETGSVECLF